MSDYLNTLNAITMEKTAKVPWKALGALGALAGGGGMAADYLSNGNFNITRQGVGAVGDAVKGTAAIIGKGIGGAVKGTAGVIGDTFKELNSTLGAGARGAYNLAKGVGNVAYNNPYATAGLIGGGLIGMKGRQMRRMNELARRFNTAHGANLSKLSPANLNKSISTFATGNMRGPGKYSIQEIEKLKSIIANPNSGGIRGRLRGIIAPATRELHGTAEARKMFYSPEIRTLKDRMGITPYVLGGIGLNEAPNLIHGRRD